MMNASNEQESEKTKEKAVDQVAGCVLTFVLGNSLYALNATMVQEVTKHHFITMIHQAPAFIVGVLNLRGKIVTVINLAKKIGLQVTEQKASATSQKNIIIVEWNNESVGLLVDQVAEVISIDHENLCSSPGNVDDHQVKFIEHIYPTNKNLIAILNIDLVMREDIDHENFSSR
ncbi:MAG: purine-binding chemotaxis protein CheW [Oligoflexia bacterium]|nr:purine-binding chemotaxis protein CheW [Oligoflexia bacterium]